MFLSHIQKDNSKKSPHRLAKKILYLLTMFAFSANLLPVNLSHKCLVSLQNEENLATHIYIDWYSASWQCTKRLGGLVTASPSCSKCIRGLLEKCQLFLNNCSKVPHSFLCFLSWDRGGGKNPSFSLRAAISTWLKSYRWLLLILIHTVKTVDRIAVDGLEIKT